MSEHKANDGKANGGKADGGKQKPPATVVSGTRVTVAFPFSKIALQEPSEDLRELAVVVADLAEAVAGIESNDVTDDLRRRATALRDQLQTAVTERR